MTFRQYFGANNTAQQQMHNTLTRILNQTYGFGSAGNKTTEYGSILVSGGQYGLDIKHTGLLPDAGCNNYFSDGQTVTSPIITNPGLFTASPTFEDDFTGPTVDASKWIYTYMDGRCTTPSTNELEWYQPANFDFSPGWLRIIGKSETVTGTTSGKPGVGSPKTYNYTSGLLASYGKFFQKYGYFECLAKIPKGQGFWPAFWLYPEAGWPPEIDIIEVLGSDTTRAYGTTWDNTGTISTQSQIYTVDLSLDFHTFAVAWQPGVITWYLDNIEFGRSYTNISQTAMHIILNLAIGGTWPGSPNGGTPFPSYFEIKHVKVWQYLAYL